MNYKTDILYYDKNSLKITKRKECEIISEFLFSKITFQVLYKNGYFYIAVPYEDTLFSIKTYPEIINNEKFTGNEIANIFRKDYLKNNITIDKINLFLQNPNKIINKK